MSRFANLSERLSADLPKDPNRPDDEDDDDMSNANREEGKKKKEKPMADNTVSAEEHASALADATAKATAAANARFNAVIGSEHYKGREALATNLLGNASMDADAIIAALATAPKAETSAVDADAEARRVMQENIDRNANSGIKPAQEGSNAQDEGPSAEAISTGWSKATARANQLAGY